VHHQAAIGGERPTQEWLAGASSVPRATISSWSTGASLPRNLDQLTKVGDVLADAAGERPLTSREWSRLQDADGAKGPACAVGEDDPVIATIDRHPLTKPHFSELVVDAGPPRPVWRSDVMLIISSLSTWKRNWNEQRFSTECARSYTPASRQDRPASG
jgi:hypothetical protein